MSWKHPLLKTVGGTFIHPESHVTTGGIYEHYKGKRYRVLAGSSIHTETNELFVVYQALYDDQLVFNRPLSMWNENLMFNGVSTPRFRLITGE